MSAEVIVEALHATPVARRRMELVERKGVGHPDTMCDSLVEAVSVALNAMYLELAGGIPHYNIDKALLVAGQCERGFGWGRLTRPIEFILGDRATFALDGQSLPVVDTVEAAVGRWLREHLPHLRPETDLVTRVALAPGSEELRGIFGTAGATGSNDTSGASGYAPLSPTEQLILDVERWLNSANFKSEFADTGQDVKVFGTRRDDRVEVTVAMPFLCTAVGSERVYFERKEAAVAALQARFRTVPFSIDWHLNALDAPARGTAGTYLTLTGTSAEDADSGQVGRGNRVNGLIAFSRPTGGEAAPGKNPVAHVGKIYSVLCHRLADRIHQRCPDLEEVYAHLAARIGQDVLQPWTGVQVVMPPGMALVDVEGPIREVVASELARLPEFQQELIRGVHPVC
jgi:S-adenosylmethionine synthetase